MRTRSDSARHNSITEISSMSSKRPPSSRTSSRVPVFASTCSAICCTRFPYIYRTRKQKFPGGCAFLTIRLFDLPRQTAAIPPRREIRSESLKRQRLVHRFKLQDRPEARERIPPHL